MNAVNNVKSTIDNAWNNIKSTTDSIWNGIKNVIDTVWNGIKSGVDNATNSIKSTVENVFNSTKTFVEGVWNGIRSAIENPIESAKNFVRNAIDTMKGFFNFSWSLPRIKLPHFSISGRFSLNPPQIPRFGVEWYKDGGIFTKPTLFNTPYGTKGVGEAGPEAVLPIEKLPTLLGFDKFDRMISLLEDIKKKSTSLYLDKDKLIGETIDEVDRQLAERQSSSELSFGGV